MAIRFRPDRVSELRKALGLSQAEFARRIQVSRQIVSHWEAGKYVPSSEVLMRMVSITGAKIESFFAEEPHAQFVRSRRRSA
jgi:transcriptional regulator with XRE-family HTH domain